MEAESGAAKQYVVRCVSPFLAHEIIDFCTIQATAKMLTQTWQRTRVTDDSSATVVVAFAPLFE